MCLNKLILITGLFSLFTFGLVAQPSILNNNGALISIREDALVIAQNSSVSNISGTIGNAGLFVIEGDFINSGTASGNGGDGIYRVFRHWENNADFIPDFTEVELYGDNQLITGTAVTTFYDLNLTGSGVKEMTINAEVLNELNLNDRELATEDHIMFVLNDDPAAIQRTSGFVSSLGDGRLSRATQSTDAYLYPVGSNVGTPRYRPVVLNPNSASAHTYAVRMANVDPTNEGYDRNETDDICVVNPEFYHLIDRTAGTDPVDINIYYVEADDGEWSTNAHWESLPFWVDMANTTQTADAQFDIMSTAAWNDFSYPAFALAVSNFGIDLLAQDVSCFGDTDGFAEIFIDGATEPVSYFWPDNENTPSRSALAPGEYTVIVTDANECEAEVNILINEPQQLSVNIEFPIYEIAVGDEALINSTHSPASDNVTYFWTPSDDLDCPDCPTVFAAPDDDTEYSVTVTNDNGCTATDQTLVIVSGEFAFFIPNAFSPNSDGNNDIFRAYGTEIERIQMKIFDRWGEILFVSNDLEVGWDGTFLGEDAPVGVYVYVVEVEFRNGREKLQSGSLSLIR